MSVRTNSAAFMAQAMNADNPHRETFHRFFECWICEQNSYLEELVSVANNHNPTENDDAVLIPLIERVVRHYEQYYQAKSNWEKRDAISMFSPTWRSKLEDAFLWIGGWRPTLAIHLLYSKSGIQLEAKIGDLIRGLKTGDLGDLSPKQMNRIDELQKKIIHQERVLSEKYAKEQEAVADRSMVELSNVVSEMIRTEDGEVDSENEEKVDSMLNSKKDNLEELLHMADDLRLETLKTVIEILTPIQAVYFLIAAAELHLRLHEWGKKKDENGTENGSATGTHNHGSDLHAHDVRV
ncbi:protein DOG1-like 3 [Lactuca sativa]|uniref:protein DOG1-like 3 n=1 Tax=Lactuca sativa TaxID=4236 RepID=UPI000CC641F4|nr:protein DOG1-like 3 [Lactuca sativa]